MAKKLIRLNESDLYHIINETTDKILKEYYDVEEPYSYETDREEQWYKVGFNDGIEKAIEWVKEHINDYLVKGKDIDYMFDDLKNETSGN